MSDHTAAMVDVFTDEIRQQQRTVLLQGDTGCKRVLQKEVQTPKCASSLSHSTRCAVETYDLSERDSPPPLPSQSQAVVTSPSWCLNSLSPAGHDGEPSSRGGRETSVSTDALKLHRSSV